MNSIKDHTQAKAPFPLLALISLAGSSIAAGWVRQFGNGSLNGLLIGQLALVIAVCLSMAWAMRQVGIGLLWRFVIAPVLFAGVFLIAGNWTGRLGAYAVPHLPDVLGACIAATAVMAGALSLVRKENAIAVAVASIWRRNDCASSFR